MSKSTIANKKKSAARQPALHKANVSGIYIRIEICSIDRKKVIEVKPYFDGHPLNELDYMSALRLLEEEKNNAVYAFK